MIKTYKNSQFKVFVISDILYWIALTIFQTGLPFFVTSLMKLPETMNFVLFILMTLLSLVFYAPINVVAKKLGKKRMVVIAMFMFTFLYIITAISGMFNIPGMVYGIAVAVLAAVPMAILGILPQAIVADIAEYDSILTKENREGMFYAARTFAFKIGQSLALLIFTAVSTINVEMGTGYRIASIIAAAMCFLGGLVLIKYNEKSVFDVIGAKKNDNSKSTR